MTIYVIAGPPGVGKSTNGKELIPVGVPIVDQGFADYQDIASLTSNQRIGEFLFNKQDFDLELNLGFPSHYSYFRSIATFDRSNRVQLVMVLHRRSKPLFKPG